MTATEIRNMLGVYDEPELNAACECERKDNLADEIAARIVREHGYSRGLYNGQVFKFPKVKDILAEYGFDYVWSDETDGSHFFYNKDSGDSIDIFPKDWFPKQANFQFQNFLLS